MAQYGTMGYQNDRLTFQKSNSVSLVLYQASGGPQDPRKTLSSVLGLNAQERFFRDKFLMNSVRMRIYVFTYFEMQL